MKIIFALSLALCPAVLSAAAPGAAPGAVPGAVPGPAPAAQIAPAAAAPAGSEPVAPPEVPVAAARKVYADAWRLKADPLDLRGAAEEIARMPLAGQERFYLLAAQALASADKPDQAVRLLEHYRLQGGKADPLVQELAHYYELIGASTESVKVMEQQLRLAPDDTETVLQLARAYRQKGDDKAAAELVESKARFKPKDVLLQRAAAAVRREKGDLAGAEEALQRSLDQQRDPETYRQLAEARAAAGRLEQALELLREGEKALPDFQQELAAYSAELCYGQGQKDRAVKILRSLADKLADPLARQPFEARIKSMEHDRSLDLNRVPNPPAGPPVPDVLRNLQPGAAAPAPPAAPGDKK